MYFSARIVFILANSADPDEMLSSAAFHLGLRTSLDVCSLQKIMINPQSAISNIEQNIIYTFKSAYCKHYCSLVLQPFCFMYIPVYNSSQDYDPVQMTGLWVKVENYSKS